MAAKYSIFLLLIMPWQTSPFSGEVHFKTLAHLIQAEFYLVTFCVDIKSN